MILSELFSRLDNCHQTIFCEETVIETYGRTLTFLQHLMPAESHIKKIKTTSEQKREEKRQIY